MKRGVCVYARAQVTQERGAHHFGGRAPPSWSLDERHCDDDDDDDDGTAAMTAPNAHGAQRGQFSPIPPPPCRAFLLRYSKKQHETSFCSSIQRQKTPPFLGCWPPGASRFALTTTTHTQQQNHHHHHTQADPFLRCCCLVVLHILPLLTYSGHCCFFKPPVKNKREKD